MWRALTFWVILLSGFASQAQEKNVLFIIVDDLKPLIHGMGEDQMVTPNMDKLISQSVLFTNAHAQQAVCAPSRVSFMTGMRPDYTRVWDLNTFMRDMNPDILTMPQYFQELGYTTSGLGKVLHGARDDDPSSWSVPFIENTDLKFAKGYKKPVNWDYQDDRIRKVFKQINSSYDRKTADMPKWRYVNEGMKAAEARPSTESKDVPDNAYVDGALTDKSIELMKEYSKRDEAFMLVLGYRKPHLPFVAPKQYWDLYDRDVIELASFQEQAKGSPAFAYHTFGELKNYSDIEENLADDGSVLKDKQRELIHGYYASVSYIDAQIGKLIEFMDESGLSENTILVLVGDHGWHLGDHGLWNKHTNFEQATRTPLLFRDPGTNSGMSNDSPVELIDIFPTVCDLTENKIPDQLQGKSLLPVLAGSSEGVNEVALSQYPRGDRMGYAVRSNRYRYIEWHKKDQSTQGIYSNENILAVELYDYEKDPLEKVNHASEEEYREVVADLKNKLKDLITAK